MTLLGRGVITSGETPINGLLFTISGPEDVKNLIGSPGLDDVILGVSSPAVSNIAPLLPRVKGVVCTTGGTTSHLALVARDFSKVSVMGFAPVGEGWPPPGQGTRITIDRDGEVHCRPQQ